MYAAQTMLAPRAALPRLQSGRAAAATAASLPAQDSEQSNSSGDGLHLPRPLLHGAPHRGDALLLQKRNLLRFVQTHAAEFEALPYHPWTSECRSEGEAGVVVGPSSLPGCEGLRGVKLLHAITTGAQVKMLLHYPGLILTEELYQLFQEEYHCPTALELPALTWTNPSSQMVHRFLILGDPTQPGAIVNDGPWSGVEGQSLVRYTGACDYLHAWLASAYGGLAHALLICCSKLQVGIGEARAGAPHPQQG